MIGTEPSAQGWAMSVPKRYTILDSDGQHTTMKGFIA